MTYLISFPARLPGARLLWCSLALTLAFVTLLIAWLIRPRGLTYDGDAFLSSVIGALGVLIALSALPIPSQSAERNGLDLEE